MSIRCEHIHYIAVHNTTNRKIHTQNRRLPSSSLSSFCPRSNESSLRVLRVGVILCAILSCVVVFVDDEVSMLLILPTPLLLILLVIRCEIDEGDSIDEGEKALHIDSTVMAAINSGSNIVIFIVIFCKERVVDDDC